MQTTRRVGRPPAGLQAPPAFSETVENYLRTIATLEDEDLMVTPAQLRNVLQVSFSTTTATLRRMSTEGLLSIETGNVIRLTPVGDIAAECVMRRHRLAETFLSRVLRLPWSEVYSLADGMEHTISPRVERQLQVVLDHPRICPHGNGIVRGTYRDHETCLAYTSPGHVVVSRIKERNAADADLMRWLERNGVLPGKPFQVAIGTADFVVLIDPYEKRISVPLRAAAAVMVRPDEPDTNRDDSRSVETERVKGFEEEP